MTTELNHFHSNFFSTKIRMCGCLAITNHSVLEMTLRVFYFVAIYVTRVFRRLVVEDACFRMRITLGVVLNCSLVRAVCVAGRLRSGSGVALN